MNSVSDALKKHISNDTLILEDEPMSSHTSFKIGGPADIMIIPATSDDFICVASMLKSMNVPVFIFGNASNLLVSDKGIRGAVIKTCNAFSKLSIEENYLTAGSGVLLSKCAMHALKYSLTGMEFAYGIPGSLGGAVYMNAGAYGGEMKDIVIKTKYLNEDMQIKELRGDEHEFSYRHSFFTDKKNIIIESMIELTYSNPGYVKEQMKEFSRRRKEKQPLDKPSAGSVFKRPEGYFAGTLIEDCGLKGYTIGGAQVSKKHAGFIVNKGNASASDVIELVDHIKQTVKEKHGVDLQCEIKFIGEL